MSSSCENFLRDACRIIRESAEEARKVRDLLHSQGCDEGAYLYNVGRTFAYYEVLTMLLHEAETFGLNATMLGLGEYDPDEALL